VGRIDRTKDGLYYAKQIRDKKLSSKELIEESFLLHLKAEKIGY